MRYLEQRKARIEIVPMIDIMLFLLIFFVMVALRMIPATGVATQLPHSSTAQETTRPKLVISLLDDGSLRLEDRLIDLAGLTARLKAGDPANTTVTVASNRTVAVQKLIEVMDACRAAGVTQLALAAHREP